MSSGFGIRFANIPKSLMYPKMLSYKNKLSKHRTNNLPIFGKFEKSIKMKNTSISLGDYFDQFVSNQVSVGRYKNVSEVVRAGLRLLEDEENKVIALRNAIQEGIDSGIAHNFDPKKNLQELKAKRKSNG